jgi:hypothetical protein
MCSGERLCLLHRVMRCLLLGHLTFESLLMLHSHVRPKGSHCPNLGLVVVVSRGCKLPPHQGADLACRHHWMC